MGGAKGKEFWEDMRLDHPLRGSLTGDCDDAFEGPAIGIEVPELADHGGGGAGYRAPGGVQGKR